MNESRAAFFPPLQLHRKDTTTAQLYYHANTSRQFGKGTSMQLYIKRSGLPDLPPQTIEMMVHLDAPPAPSDSVKVYQLHHTSDHPGNAVRYDEQAQNCDVGSVYLPPLMLSKPYPDTCYLSLSVSS